MYNERMDDFLCVALVLVGDRKGIHSTKTTTYAPKLLFQNKLRNKSKTNWLSLYLKMACETAERIIIIYSYCSHFFHTPWRYMRYICCLFTECV